MNKITVRNTKDTSKTREIKVPSLKSLQRVISDGVDKCVGPCKCTVEPDGSCPNGWRSRSLEAGAI